MELEVGMYVRTKKGTINKIFEIDKILKYEKEDRLIVNEDDWFLVESDLVKASHSIIDLIQVGDYVNGGRVVEHAYQPGRLFVECIYVGGKGQTTIENYSWELTSKYVEDEPDAIKSIVTKEQFSSMEYKVGE
jgi:hypothetical protein